MTLHATRFGALDIPSSKRWTCSEPIPGFEELHEFALLRQTGQAPFIWLQSLEVSNLAFLIVDAACFGLRFVQAQEQEPPGLNVLSCVLVILPQGQGEPLRVHRLAPLLFDIEHRCFMQRVFEAEQVLGDGVWSGQLSERIDADWHARIIEFQPPPQAEIAASNARASGRDSELAVP